MKGSWRDRRSFSALGLGLFFLFLAVRPAPSLESGFRATAAFFLPASKSVKPFRTLAGARSTDPLPPAEGTPNAEFLLRREAEFLKPKDERLLARLFAFASRCSDAAEPGTIWLEAGSKQAVSEGMLAVAGDALLGEIVRVEAEKALLRLPTHPDSQLGARAGETRLVAAGGRHGWLRVELPSGRGLESGQEVRGEPVPALLGRLEPSPSGRKGALAIRPALDASMVCGMWLLRAGEGSPSLQGSAALLALPDASWTEATALWPEISPHARGGTFVVPEGLQIEPGAACVASGFLWGIVERANEETLWIRSLDDPTLHWDALLVRADGVVRRIPNFTLAQLAGAGEGWLFTAGGKQGMPKGLLAGQVKRADSGFFLDRDFSAFPASLRVALPGSRP